MTFVSGMSGFSGVISGNSGRCGHKIYEARLYRRDMDRVICPDHSPRFLLYRVHSYFFMCWNEGNTLFSTFRAKGRPGGPI